jgi:hypothetical protein
MTDPDCLILRPTMIGGESLTVRFDYPSFGYPSQVKRHSMKPNNKCTRCDGTGWVCETHLLRPWKGCGCGAAKLPCGRCNPGDEDISAPAAKADVGPVT